jgi:hypothetical protein
MAKRTAEELDGNAAHSQPATPEQPEKKQVKLPAWVTSLSATSGALTQNQRNKIERAKTFARRLTAEVGNFTFADVMLFQLQLFRYFIYQKIYKNKSK